MDITSYEYRRAFDTYMRKGIPVEQTLLDFELKAKEDENPTTHYIWRTRGDQNVRPEHARNNGKTFAWDSPPDTGHPGEDFGCRCEAEPYYPAIAESFEIQFTNVADTGPKWSHFDFINHYFFGNGKTIRVRETGHLLAVNDEYRRIVIDDIKRLPGQIAERARANIGRPFGDTFGRPYNMISIVFSLGNSTIKGTYFGFCEEINGVLQINGSILFHLRDIFEDPTGIRDFLKLRNDKFVEVEFGEIPLSNKYDIVDDWGGKFNAIIYQDPKRSRYAPTS